MNKDKVKDILNSRPRKQKNKSIYKKHLHKANRNKNKSLLKSLDYQDQNENYVFYDKCFGRDYDSYHSYNDNYLTYKKWFDGNVEKNCMVQNFGYIGDSLLDTHSKLNQTEKDFVTNQNLNGLLCYLVPKHKRYLFKRIATLNVYLPYKRYQNTQLSKFNDNYFKSILYEIIYDSEAHRTLNHLIKIFIFDEAFHKIIPYRGCYKVPRLLKNINDIDNFWSYVNYNYFNSSENANRTKFDHYEDFMHPEYYYITRWFLHNYYINHYNLLFIQPYACLFDPKTRFLNINLKRILLQEIINHSC